MNTGVVLIFTRWETRDLEEGYMQQWLLLLPRFVQMYEALLLARLWLFSPLTRCVNHPLSPSLSLFNPTQMIDVKAYGGQDMRKMISEELRVNVMLDEGGAYVCDLCCGIGISTRALGRAFHDAELIIGVDISPEMISMAKAISRHKQGVRSALARHAERLKSLLGQKYKAVFEPMTVIETPDHEHVEATYRLANAGESLCIFRVILSLSNNQLTSSTRSRCVENTDLRKKTFDLVTIMYAFHEVPKEGRTRIIQEAKRLLKVGGTLAVVDISPTYTPSKYMLAGEPFVIEYQQNIDRQLASVPGFRLSKREEIVPGHLNMWLLTAK
jgi:ubiquinone/menaquinone biosynthesis C-methylase UbiE